MIVRRRSRSVEIVHLSHSNSRFGEEIESHLYFRKYTALKVSTVFNSIKNSNGTIAVVVGGTIHLKSKARHTTRDTAKPAFAGPKITEPPELRD